MNNKIKEMAKLIRLAKSNSTYSKDIATALYNAGYRKQSDDGQLSMVI